MLKLKWKGFFLEAELEDMAALKAKGAIFWGTEWCTFGEHDMVYSFKADHYGYVIRLKTRIVTLGNSQRLGIDIQGTFALIARVSSFWLLIALESQCLA